jgi:hypothetical protein
MPLQTFNPISDPFEHIPTQRPGTVVVTFENGKARSAAMTGTSLQERAVELVNVRTGGAFAIAMIVLIWLLGFAGFFLLLVLTAALSIYVIINRRSPLAVFLMGSTPAYYLVDISPHTVSDERRIQLADTGIYATVEIEYRAIVEDPVAVVQQGIQDVREYISRKIYIEIAKAAAEGTLADNIDGLRKQLNEIAAQIPQDEVISIEQVTLDVGVEGTAADDLARLAAASLQKKGLKVQQDLDDLRRAYFEKIITDDNALLAEMMRPGVDKATLQMALRSRLEASETTFNQKLALLKMAFEHGVLEQHQIRNQYPEFFNQIKQAMTGLVDHSADRRPPTVQTVDDPKLLGKGNGRETGDDGKPT